MLRGIFVSKRAHGLNIYEKFCSITDFFAILQDAPRRESHALVALRDAARDLLLPELGEPLLDSRAPGTERGEDSRD